jgi:hypothetical protein
MKISYIWIIALATAVLLIAQAPISITPFQAIDTRTGAGIACNGCSLFTYVAGSSTPQATYTDASLTTPNTNPILTNAAGYTVNGSTIVGVWIAPGVCYKLILEDAANVVIWTQDHVCGIVTGTSVSSFNSRTGAVTLTSGDVAAVEQDLRTTASPTFAGLSIGGNSTFTGAVTFASAITFAGASGSFSATSSSPVVTVVNSGTGQAATMTANNSTSVLQLIQSGAGLGLSSNGQIASSVTSSGSGVSATQAGSGNAFTGLATGGGNAAQFIGPVVFTSGGIITGSSAGVSCTGTPTSSFATINGIVTHC